MGTLNRLPGTFVACRHLICLRVCFGYLGLQLCQTFQILPEPQRYPGLELFLGPHPPQSILSGKTLYVQSVGSGQVAWVQRLTLSPVGWETLNTVLGLSFLA